MTEIKNKEIIDIYLKEGKAASLCFLKGNGGSDCKEQSLSKSLETVVNGYKSINKSKGRPSFEEKMNFFLDKLYTFPQKKQIIRKSASEKICENMTEDTASSVVLSLASDMKQIHSKCETVVNQNKELKSKLAIRQARLSRYNSILKDKKDLDRKVSHLNMLLLSKNATLKQVRAAKTYAQTQVEKLKSQVEGQKKRISDLQEIILQRSVQSDILSKSLNDTIEANEYLLSLQNNDTVTLYDEDAKVYNKDAQQLIYALLGHNVTTSKVTSVIETVLKFVNLKPNRLPCLSTINNMNIQRLILSQKQLADVLAQKSNLCLLSDETSKYGKKIEGFHLCDDDGQIYIMGLRQMVTKSGQDTLSTLQNILTDIDCVSEKTVHPVSKHILLNIVSTMSDSAATQKKFNALLEDYRKLIITEELGQAWYDMSYAEQMAISKLNNFFCGLHALVHIAETANKSIQVAEEAFFDGEPPISDPHFRTAKESGSTRLIRTASKAFSCGGDEKCGVYGSFSVFVKDFLKENNLYSIPIQRFHGNRFNILFSNAASVFFLHEKITEYLTGDCCNGLLKSVYHDICKPEYVAGVKALGLISHLITTPLWVFLEDKDIHILDSARYYTEIITFIEQAVLNVQDFIEGRLVLSFANEDAMNRNVIFKKLVEHWEHDEKVITILSTLLPAILDSVKILFSDFLEGGEWAQVSPSKREKTKAVPKNNKFSETVFGHVDRILREKPNISTIAQEAYVMFCHNRTLKWLESKEEGVKDKLMAEARKDVKETRLLFKQRRTEIEAKRKILIREKFLKNQEKERKRVQKLENFTNDILDWGLWQTVEQVDQHLLLYKTKKEKMAGLKAQLKFRKELLHQKPKDDELKNVYLLSKTSEGKKKNLSVEELTENVKKLVTHALKLPQSDNHDGPVLVGMNIRMRFDTDRGVQWYKGFVISKVFQFQTKAYLNPCFHICSSSLRYSSSRQRLILTSVFTFVVHIWCIVAFETEGGINCWYKGFVLHDSLSFFKVTLSGSICSQIAES